MTASAGGVEFLPQIGGYRNVRLHFVNIGEPPFFAGRDLE
jgi:hypothetical protein